MESQAHLGVQREQMTSTSLLTAALADHGHWSTRLWRVAAWALRCIGIEKSHAVLERSWATERDEEVRSQIVVALDENRTAHSTSTSTRHNTMEGENG